MRTSLPRLISRFLFLAVVAVVIFEDGDGPSVAVSALSISVAPVVTPRDILDLADLRFDEWMTSDKDVDGGGKEKGPSREAFRMATAEIARERAAGGAVMFLARDKKSDAVGAAELSPIEFEGALLREDDAAARHLYVTDVVTAREHRRKGVAGALMCALEREAASGGAGPIAPPATIARLFLHVHADNGAALNFYRGVGGGRSSPTSPPPGGGASAVYGEPPVDVMSGIDAKRLAENAGAVGQVLLCKEISIVKNNPRGAGFGTATGGGGGSKKSRPKKRR